MILVDRVTSGGRPLLLCAAAGVLGLAATAAGAIAAPRIALLSYLFGYAYWLGLALGMLVLLGSFHASRARWPVVVRRFIELCAGTLPIFVLLFIPILVWMSTLFPWVDQRVASKGAYLNVPFFIARAVLYFVIWIVTAELLLRWSRRQDESGALELTVMQRRLGGGSLPFVGLAISFAATDWVMSIEPSWWSSVFPLYYFAGGFVGAVALIAVAAAWLRGPDQFGAFISVVHLRWIGTFLLAFVIFWAYIAYSQFMLTWIANLPAQVPWYLWRAKGGWGTWAAVLVALQFCLPFFTLLPRSSKESRPFLVGVALVVLFAHALDTYWMILPVVRAGTGPVFHWTAVTAFLGVGGLSVAFGIWRARGGYLVPVRDPFLLYSIQVKD